jgi:lipoprotein-anchoring transpeptidase ErfK/SrfK
MVHAIPRLVNQSPGRNDKERRLALEPAFQRSIYWGISRTGTFTKLARLNRLEASGQARSSTMRTATLIASVAFLAMAVGAQSPAHARAGVLSGYEPGTIVVKTGERKLYLVLENGETISYPVGVGRTGRTWTGVAYINGKFIQPAWSPPADVRREKPSLPDVIAGGTSQNPMGAAAMTLSVDQYAIHGTNKPESIGGFVSFGCIRMHNQDVLDLYRRVKIGTPVVVLR